ncbi:MAG: hypothetical protein ACLUNQ_07540 [Oscillospiraceae bacterium]
MKYAAKKIGLMLLTMVIVSFLAFLAFQVIPGNPAVKLLGTEATPEAHRRPAGGNGTGPSVLGAVRPVGAGGPARGLRHVVQL